MAVDLKGVIDTKNGLVSRRAFVEQEIFDTEMEQVFGRCWLFIAHESQIPNPGDFFTSYMGVEPVIVIRDSAGKIGAFLNTCRHRGNAVCLADQGNAASFTCSYHAWTYGNDGKLIGVPNAMGAYFDKLDMEQWGLIPVAQLKSYKGLIFATFDPAAPSLEDYLGEHKFYLDLWLDRREGGTEVIGGVHKWIMPANWKFAADNFVGDTLHFVPSHASAVMSGLFSSARALSINPRSGFQTSSGYGHGIIVSYQPGNRHINVPDLEEYEASIEDEAVQRLGPSVRNISPIVSTIFPNFSPFYGRATIRCWHPRGPDKTEIWAWCLVDKEAPPEVKDRILKHYLWTFGPAGSAEQDDMGNWQHCTRNSAGPIAKRYPLNYMLAMDDRHYDENYPGYMSMIMSEHDARLFYDVWGEMMAGKSWPEIKLELDKIKSKISVIS